MRKVRLRVHTRLMDLSEHHLPRGTVLSSPGGDVFLEGPHLTLLVTTRVERSQQSEQRGGLERIVALELLDDPGTVGLEVVRPGSVPTRLFELTGKLAETLVRTSRTYAHPSAVSRLFLSAAFGAFSHHAQDLQITFHGAFLLQESTMLNHRRRPPLRRQL